MLAERTGEQCSVIPQATGAYGLRLFEILARMPGTMLVHGVPIFCSRDVLVFAQSEAETCMTACSISCISFLSLVHHGYCSR